VWYTVQRWTVLIISSLILQQIIIAQMLSTGGDRTDISRQKDVFYVLYTPLFKVANMSSPAIMWITQMKIHYLNHQLRLTDHIKTIQITEFWNSQNSSWETWKVTDFFKQLNSHFKKGAGARYLIINWYKPTCTTDDDKAEISLIWCEHNICCTVNRLALPT